MKSERNTELNNHEMQIVGILPDISELALLLKSVQGEEAYFAVLPYSRLDLDRPLEMPLDWTDKIQEESYFAKQEFLKLEHPLTADDLKDVVACLVKIWENYSSDLEIREYRKNILENKMIEEKHLQQLYQRMSAVAISAADALYEERTSDIKS